MNKIIEKIRKRCSALRFAGTMLMLFAFCSCDYLNIDNYIDEQLKFDSIFATKRYIEAYMWDAAGKFPDESNLFNGSSSPGIMATDEAFTIGGTGTYRGMGYVLGEYNPENINSFGDVGETKRNFWHIYYQIIRQCNTIFLRIDEADDWLISERTLVLAYTRFIRAYAYYNLLINWGPVVIVGDEIAGNNEEVEYYDRPRDLYDDCIEYICGEFEAAALNLPDKAASIMTFGRPTKGAAYALVARLRLMHASPLFNGGQVARIYYGGWTRKTDGEHYIQQTYDPRRWAVAAAAAKRVMDLKITGAQAYKLHTVENYELTPAPPTNVNDVGYGERDFPYGIRNIDPFHSYSDMFTGEAIAYVNPELIWARSGALTGQSQASFPFDGGGWNEVCVTQKIVDAYEMADGRLRTAFSEEYPYSETGFTEQPTSFSGYRLNANVYNMYANREMRFYASIGFSECFWPCLSSSESRYRNVTVTYDNGSLNGRSSAPNNYPITGYVIKKYINEVDAWAGTSRIVVSKSFPTIRYAEILLSYAEALNELEGYSFDIDGTTYARNNTEIGFALNQVRYRAGLPGLVEAELNDPSYVRSKIKKERMVEFLFENRRYYDVRRWGDYETSETQTIMGMNTSAIGDSYYQRVIPSHKRIASRIVNKKMIFLPIPTGEIKRLPKFDQNPGW